MKLNIPCIDCIHFNECKAKITHVKELFSGRVSCYDYDTGMIDYSRVNHKNPLGAHLFSRADGKCLLPDKEEELKSLNEEYLNALRPSILQLLQICELLLRYE